jgi:hypothetical protein
MGGEGSRSLPTPCPPSPSPSQRLQPGEACGQRVYLDRERAVHTERVGCQRVVQRVDVLVCQVERVAPRRVICSARSSWVWWAVSVVFMV